MSCEPTLQNVAFYLQGVAVTTSPNLTYDYFVTASLPSSKVNRRVWQFESQGTLTGPVTPDNSTFVLDYTQAHEICPQFNITFQGRLNGVLNMKNETLSANQYLSYRLLRSYVLELKFKKLPRSIVECVGPVAFYFSVNLSDAAAQNTVPQPPWLFTCVIPVITTNQQVSAAAVPTQLSTYDATQATDYGSGYYFLNGQTGTVGSPIEGGGDFSATFGTYYLQGTVPNQRTLPDMSQCKPRVIDSSTQAQLDKVGTRLNVKGTLAEFSQAHFLDLTPCFPQHSHDYPQRKFGCSAEVTDAQLGAFFEKSIHTQKYTSSSPYHVNGKGNCGLDQSVAGLIPVNPMKYNFASAGYTTTYYTVANDVTYNVDTGPGQYMRTIMITDDFVFLSCGNTDVYYNSGIVQNTKVNNRNIASIQYPVDVSGNFHQTLFEELYPKTGDEWFLGVDQVSLGLSNLLYHDHSFDYGNIATTNLGPTKPLQSSCVLDGSINSVSSPYPTTPNVCQALPITNSVYLTLNSLPTGSPPSPAYFPVGAILSIKGSSPLLVRGPDGRLPATLYSGSLLLCDGSTVDPALYPILSGLLTDNNLPDFITYGDTLYSVGPDTSGLDFATTVNTPVFPPVADYPVDRSEPLTGYNDNFTIYWLVAARTVSEIANEFGVSYDTLQTMNPTVVTSPNQTISSCDPVFNNGVVLSLPAIPSVMTKMYCRMADHSHEVSAQPTGTSANSAIGERTRIKTITIQTNFTTAIANKPDKNQYEPFVGYPSTVAIAYYIVAA